MVVFTLLVSPALAHDYVPCSANPVSSSRSMPVYRVPVPLRAHRDRAVLCPPSCRPVRVVLLILPAATTGGGALAQVGPWNRSDGNVVQRSWGGDHMPPRGATPSAAEACGPPSIRGGAEHGRPPLPRHARLPPRRTPRTGTAAGRRGAMAASIGGIARASPRCPPQHGR